MAIEIKTLPSAVNDQDWRLFNAPADGLYCITIIARCKNWWQNLLKLRFSDDDLAVQIDDFQFFELKGKKREFNTIGSWNGNELKNNSKAVIIIIPLRAGEHKITFWTDKSPGLEIVDVSALLIGEKSFVIPAPANIAAMDMVLKNVVEQKINVINLNGVEKTVKGVVDWPPGIRVVSLVKHGEPIPKSIGLTITDSSIRYKIGCVKLYRDITTLSEVNLFPEPNTKLPSLAVMRDGEEIEVIDERIVGEWVASKSNIWHKARYQNQEGFILSSFVEIQGQEREKIVDLITAKCNEKKDKKEDEKEKKVDPNIMLAIAGVESHFKPYAVGFTDDELVIFKQNNNKDDDDILGARGVFQLRGKAAKQMAVNNRFDFYQNIAGGVEYYKWIMGQVNGRGNIDEKRLIAWHDGLGNVPKKYDYGKLSGDMQKFMTNVFANIKKRDWKNIILLLVFFLVVTAGYGIKREGVIKTAPIVDDSFSLKTESAVAASANSAPDFKLVGDSLIFDKVSGGIKKIIVREGRNQDDWPITKLAYWSESGSVTAEMLDGWLVEAGWKDGFFYIMRQSGMHYTPTAVYSLKNGRLEKVKIVEKNGRVRDEFDAPVFLTEPYQKIVRERQYATADVPHNTYIVERKDFKYFLPDNTFYEFKRIREETDMGNG